MWNQYLKGVGAIVLAVAMGTFTVGCDNGDRPTPPPQQEQQEPMSPEGHGQPLPPQQPGGEQEDDAW